LLERDETESRQLQRKGKSFAGLVANKGDIADIASGEQTTTSPVGKVNSSLVINSAVARNLQTTAAYAHECVLPIPAI